MRARIPPYDALAHDLRAYRNVPRRFGFRAGSYTRAATWQRRFRPALRRAIGLENIERDLAGYRPRARRVERVRMEGYVREKWYLMTEPDVPLPFWLLIPDGGPARKPLVLTPHGHNHPEIYVGLPGTAEERTRMTSGQRDIAVQAAREGYLAIAPTTRAFGLTRRREHIRKGDLHSCREELLHGLLVGRTPIGERVWDISRLIDWALGRGGVDPARIAITGNSGGGTVSLFAAACETRIAVAMPSCYFCTFVGSIGSIHHCACNYVPGILRLGEMYDVAGLIAPRPFLAIAGKHDDIFPLRYVRVAHEKLRMIYRVFGATDRCALHVGGGGHRYYSAGAWPFLRRWFS